MTNIIRRGERGGLRRPLRDTGLLRADPFDDLLSWDPLQSLREMMRWEPMSQRALSWRTFSPSFELRETSEAFRITADLPGVRQEDLEISVDGDLITVRGQRDEEIQEEDEEFYLNERSYGSFSRSFRLSQAADIENVEADLSDGILNITVPKREGERARRVEVTSGKKPRQIATKASEESERTEAKAKEAKTSEAAAPTTH